MQIKQSACVLNKKGAIFTQSGKPQKLVEEFTYFNSNILSTESKAFIHLLRGWYAIDGLSVI